MPGQLFGDLLLVLHHGHNLCWLEQNKWLITTLTYHIGGVNQELAWKHCRNLHSPGTTCCFVLRLVKGLGPVVAAQELREQRTALGLSTAVGCLISSCFWKAKNDTRTTLEQSCAAVVGSARWLALRKQVTWSTCCAALTVSCYF